jgi:hypothetical protein
MLFNKNSYITTRYTGAQVNLQRLLWEFYSSFFYCGLNKTATVLLSRLFLLMLLLPYLVTITFPNFDFTNWLSTLNPLMSLLVDLEDFLCSVTLPLSTLTLHFSELQASASVFSRFFVDLSQGTHSVLLLAMLWHPVDLIVGEDIFGEESWTLTSLLWEAPQNAIPYLSLMLGDNLNYLKVFAVFTSKVAVISFGLKFITLILLLIFVRGGIPRYRYDFLTKMGWFKYFSWVLLFFLLSFFLYALFS